MAFLTVKPESVQTEGGSGHLYKSGIYTLTLKNAEVAITANKATQINYFFDKVMSYGNNILGVNGQPTFGYKILESLAAVLGLEQLSDPEPMNVVFKTKTEEKSCIPELTDVEVKAWIQFSYKIYNGKMQEKVSVRRFYRESDGASGSEVLTGEDIGARLKKDSEVADEIIYEEGATPENVELWKKSQMSQNGRGSATPPTTPASTTGFPGSKPKTGFPGAK